MNRPAPAQLINQWIEEYYLPLHRYAYHLSGSRADADDLAQETFCAAQMKWQQLHDHTRARPWLFAILRNAYLRKQRDEKTRGTTRLVDVPDPWTERPLFDVDPVELRQALADLPETFRTPVILFYFDDFTYRDIAEQMDLPIGTVMSRLARAKAYLRARLLGETATSVGTEARP
jgi:RNA polymerase sigma-70 factor (ECF subfamily)